MRLRIFGAMLLVFVAVQYAHAVMDDDPSGEIRKLQQMRSSGEQKPDMVKFRSTVIKDAAYTLGVQAGVYWRNTNRLASLERYASLLDRIFNFTPLLLQGDVLPPVIIEAGAGLRIENNTTATSVIRQYKIISDARFVGTVPSWRSYLMNSYEKPENINPLVLPKNGEEQEIWNLNTQNGFHDGIKQADLVFETQLNALARDYRGIIRFTALSRQGIVSIPEISRGKCSIAVNGKQLTVGERIFRVSGTQFQAVESWKAR